MAGAALAAQASPRTAALARSSLVTHCSRASSRRVWPPAPTYRASSRARLAFDNGACTLARAPYSEAILEWWRTNSSTFPAWALAARIVFAISPNSASCERVFALLKNLFGEQQMLALADYVQASLMLNYNGRRVG